MANRNTAISSRQKVRRRGLVALGAICLIIFALLYFEQAALLYVLATLGVTVLLLIIAFADLGEKTRVFKSVQTDRSNEAGSVLSQSPSRSRR